MATTSSEFPSGDFISEVSAMVRYLETSGLDRPYCKSQVSRALTGLRGVLAVARRAEPGVGLTEDKEQGAEFATRIWAAPLPENALAEEGL